MMRPFNGVFRAIDRNQRELQKTRDTSTMQIAEVIGRVTLSRWHPALQGCQWRLVAPLELEGLAGGTDGRLEPIAAYDDLGSGLGAIVAIADGAEAAAPFQPQTKPIDAYTAAILDQIRLEK